MDFGFLLGVLAQTLSIYTVVLIVRVLLSWFPNLDWGNPVLSAVSSITDPYLNVFRGLIPPLGGLDASPARLAGRLNPQSCGPAHPADLRVGEPAGLAG